MPLPAALFGGELEKSPAVRCLGFGRIRVVIAGRDLAGDNEDGSGGRSSRYRCCCVGHAATLPRHDVADTNRRCRRFPHRASTSCDIAPHFRLPCRGRSNSGPPETADLDMSNITYFWDGCKVNQMPRVSKCSRSEHAVGSRWRRHGVHADRHAAVSPTTVAAFNSVGVTRRNAHQPRLRWARMAEMVAVVASALPPPKWA
jgi:hypothetical protein